MDDLFKKFINTGVGFLAQGNKAVQTAIEKLVQESKISEQEGKKIVDDLRKNGETKRADLEKQFKGLTEDLRTRVGLGSDKPAPAAPKAQPATKKAAASPTAKATGDTKKAADEVSATAPKAQPAAAKAGAAKPRKASAAKNDAASTDQE
jgi:polyhydroxyalkanoate synthesis regulator phasin